MYRDKLLTTFRNLNHKFDGLAELLTDRNLILKVLTRKEQREDFLLGERIQSLDEVGGVSVQAMNRNVDLSPVNNMMPPLNIKGSGSEDKEVPFKMGGAVGMQPIIDITAQNLGSEPTDEPYQTLEESNAIVPIDKAASAIVEDFEIDKKFKKAFQTAMTLPSKAAAAGLTDLLSKTPTQGEGTTVIKKNLKVLSSAFKLPTPEAPTEEAAPDVIDVDAVDLSKEEKAKKDKEIEQYEANKGKNVFELGVQWLMGKAASGGAAGSPSGAPALPPAQGDPLIPDFATAPGYMPGYIGDGKGLLGRIGGGLKSFGKKAFEYSPVGLGMKAAGAAKDKFQNITENKGVRGFFKGAGNFAKKAFKYTPMGMAASLGGGIINKIRGGDQTTNLNELTENVITEENQRKQEIIDQAKNPTPGIAAMPMPGAPKGSGGSSMDQGGDEAIPKIKYSPYFDSYAETSQF